MVIIGIDPHPDSHTAAALDSNAKVLSHLTINNDKQGLKELKAWLKGFNVHRCGIEGANNPFARKLSAFMFSEGYDVVDVRPNLTSQYRSKKGSHKTDEVDAENVARALAANPELVSYSSFRVIEDLKELTRSRETLVSYRKSLDLSLRTMQNKVVSKALLKTIESLKKQIKAIEKEMQSIVNKLMPELTSLLGIALIRAATILAETSDIRRFKNKHAYAMFAGCAPIERSSGKHKRRQVNKGGNRKLNTTIHMIIQTRLCFDEETRSYINKKLEQGKTMRAAIRCLKTYIARQLYIFMLKNTLEHPERWAGG